MERLWAHKEAGELEGSKALMRRLGHMASTIEYVLNPESYYVPNLRQGKLVRPKRVDRDAIAVVPLLEGKTYVSTDSHTIHSRQRAVYLQMGYPNADITAMEATISENRGSVYRLGGEHVAAAVFTRLHTPIKGRGAGVSHRARPVVVYHAEKSRRKPSACPGALMHELVHVAQNLEDPFYDENDRLNDELAAYAVQAKMLDSFNVEYTLDMAMAQTVDLFRQKNLGRDVYEATPEFEEMVLAHDTLGRILS